MGSIPKIMDFIKMQANIIQIVYVHPVNYSYQTLYSPPSISRQKK